MFPITRSKSKNKRSHQESVTMESTQNDSQTIVDEDNCAGQSKRQKSEEMDEKQDELVVEEEKQVVVISNNENNENVNDVNNENNENDESNESNENDQNNENNENDQNNENNENDQNNESNENNENDESNENNENDESNENNENDESNENNENDESNDESDESDQSSQSNYESPNHENEERGRERGRCMCGNCSDNDAAAENNDRGEGTIEEFFRLLIMGLNSRHNIGNGNQQYADELEYHYRMGEFIDHEGYHNLTPTEKQVFDHLHNQLLHLMNSNEQQEKSEEKEPSQINESNEQQSNESNEEQEETTTRKKLGRSLLNIGLDFYQTRGQMPMTLEEIAEYGILKNMQHDMGYLEQVNHHLDYGVSCLLIANFIREFHNYPLYQHLGEIHQYYAVQKAIPTKEEYEEYIRKQMALQRDPEQFHMDNKHYIPAKNIEQLQSIVYEKTEEVKCGVCMNMIHKGDKIYRLPCGGQHIFHAQDAQCLESMTIIDYLNQHKYCPMCRDEITIPTSSTLIADE
jgi:hypothetical protein